MKQAELESLIDSRAQSKVAEATAALKKELGTGAKTEAEFNAAVEKAVKGFFDDAEKSKSVNFAMLEAFEKSNRAASAKGAIKEDPVSIVNGMIETALFAMEDRKATNISNVGNDALIESAKKHFADRPAIGAMFEQRKALEGGIPSAGGFTIPTAFSGDYIKYLYANTILDKLGVRRVPMPNGNFTTPKMATTAAVSWVGETEQNTTTQATFSAVNLKAKKLKALTAISNTLLRYSGVGLDAWISDDLREKARIGLDTAFLYGAGTEYTPRGLVNQTGVQSYGSTTTPMALATPIDMVALLEQANVPMTNVKWLLSPTGKAWIQKQAFSSGPWAWALEMAQSKTVNGYPFVTSSTVAYTPNISTPASSYSDIFIGDFDQMLWGVGYDMSLEMSREGTFSDGNGNNVSAFDQDLTLVRLITEHDFGCRQAVGFVHGVVQAPSA